MANPLIWWAAVAAALYLVYRLIRYREWRAGLILTGVAAGYLPWLLYPNRTVFQFYTIAFEPYLILGLTFVIGIILGRRTRPELEPAQRHPRGRGVPGRGHAGSAPTSTRCGPGCRAGVLRPALLAAGLALIPCPRI